MNGVIVDWDSGRCVYNEVVDNIKLGVGRNRSIGQHLTEGRNGNGNHSTRCQDISTLG